MIKLPNEETSSLGESTYHQLREDIEVEVAVVGGGITGATTAYLLQKSGMKVALVEKNSLGSGTTGGTTGKVTSQHGLKYADLYHRFGEQTAKTYGEANQAAIEKIENLVKKEKIKCDWSRDDNYV